MKHSRLPLLLSLLMLAGGSVATPVVAADDLILTEFMAENDSTLPDEDNDYPDWVEIYNAGTTTVNLSGWYLTDKSDNLVKWRFPSTNLTANHYLVVFASGKDRRTPGRPLHTSFRLDNNGSYLALVKPDGVTVQSSFAPFYPLQVAGVSYGRPFTLTTTVLVSNGSPGRLTVPLNDALGDGWTSPAFNDASWAAVSNGVGFEGSPVTAAAPVLLADSLAEFSGNQGSNGWSYGYWSKKADANGVYETNDFIPFPRGLGTVLNTTNYFNGTKWDWPAGNPPSTEMTAGGGMPSGENGNAANPIHWIVRRYISETNGPLRLSGILACVSTNNGSARVPGSCGDGVIGHIYVDGTEVYNQSVFGVSLGYSIVVNASLGSVIDFAIDPGPAANDQCDTNAVFTAVIRTSGGATPAADTMTDWSESGAQGQNGWTYGYFNATAGGAYATAKFTPFPSGTGPHSSGNFWNGESWQWFSGDPPFDLIGRVETRPSVFTTGGINGNQHWVIRRWISEVSGTLQLDWHIAKKNLTGGGVTGNVFQNGTQRDSFNLTAADFIGTNRTITLSNVQVGDAIDISIQSGADVIGDLCFLNATIHGTGTLANQFVSNVGTLMTNINASAYLRLPFTVADASALNGLTLRMKYDDGFVAYLNGTRIASANAQETNGWNAAASAERADTEAVQFQEFNLDTVKDFLVSGANVLAIHGLNASAADPDFLITAELLASRASINPSTLRYFASPSPGSINGVGSTNLGPLITKILHTPAEPQEAEDLIVTAKVSPTVNAVTNVSLYYRVMFGAETAVSMLDDGLHGDGGAGDGIYGAIIPNQAYTPGQLVRYYFISRDNANNQTRQPALADTNNSSLYFGTVVKDPSLTNSLPVLHWFTQAIINSTTFARAIFYYQGELYDNVKMNTHGQSSGGFRNHSFNVDFNPDHNFKPDATLPRVDDINLLSTYADKAHMRLMLSYQIYSDSGPNAPYHFAVPVRMQSNGVFHSIMHIVENGDDKYLKRLGRDPNGALYKMYTDPSVETSAEKKTRRWEDKQDFKTFVAGINSATNRAYLFDNLDVSEAVNFFAAMIVTASIDCCHKNFYLYRDSDGDGEWEMLPWDLDLSFGRNWQSGETYWDDRVYPNNGLFVGGSFPLGQNFVWPSGSQTRAMYLRRVRTLQDQLLQTNGTAAADLNFEKQINRWTEIMAADGLLDLAKWGTWGGGNGGDGGNGTRIDSPASPFYRNLSQAAAEMKTNYLVNRRAFAFAQKMGNAAEYPDAQPTNAVVLIGTLDYSPASGNQGEEYLQLINTNAYAVDISGWKLGGAVDHTFQGGVVIPRAGSSNILFVVADKKAFRARSVSPRGGQGLYLEGPYQGQLSARGETIYLSNRVGRLVSTNLYTGNPSGPQQWLRVTEIMYHPPNPPAGSPYEAEDFEYVEFRNTGPTNISLLGVHFANGLEFNFTGSAITNLDPGAYALVVRNINAFTNRYGPNSRIAGAYVGILDNGGENLRLDDAVGEKILDFDYDNAWYAVTDGPGAALVIVNQNALWNTWGLKQSWRPSAYDYGSPAATDPATNSYVPVVVNEVFTHSDPPLRDAIEIFNPTGQDANLSGWFLSDDFATPKKFRIPDGTVLPQGGYLSIDENNFNPTPGVPPSFSFSSRGDEVYLFSGNGTNLTGYVQGYAFGASETGVSFGTYANSQGVIELVAQSERTFGSSNALPKVGPVVIGEILYHPQDLPGIEDNTQDEFIELSNPGGAPVPLYDVNNPANTWTLRNAVDFDFPPGVSLPGGGSLLVVGFNPASTSLASAFRAKFGVSNSVPLYGPFSGKLDNSGGSVELYKPDAPESNTVPAILVERVRYSDDAPWPLAADGLGGSLQRLVPSSYGNDATNWIAAAPSGGRPFSGGNVPVITTPPVNNSALLGSSGSFSVTVSGTPPFAYQWQFYGTNLPGANSSVLLLSNVQMNQAGPYRVIIFSAGGSTQSSNAVLSVLVPATITTQPQSVSLRGSSNIVDYGNTTNNATFTVGASGTGTVTYQWRFNGVNIPGAVATTLTVNNVQLSSEGTYDALITDSVGTITSASAKLSILITPVFVQVPLSQTVPAGSVLALSTSVRGNPAPFGYQWRSNSLVFPLIVSDSRSNFFTIRTATNAVSAIYRVVVTNAASTGNGVSATFTITTAADTDLDGLADTLETTLGLNPNDPADGAGDLDHDGMSNRDEAFVGTDLSDPNSYLRVDQNTFPGTATVRVAAVSNRTYTVQFTDALPGSNWQKLADLLARTTNRVELVPDPSWTSNRFYRVVSPTQP